MFKILTYNQLINESNNDICIYIAIRSREEYYEAIDFLNSKRVKWMSQKKLNDYTPRWINYSTVEGSLWYNINRLTLLQTGSIREPNISVRQLINNEGKLKENNENFIFKSIPLPQRYPNMIYCWNWLNEHDEEVIRSRKVRFLTNDWNLSEEDYDVFQKELSVKEIYVKNGYLFFKTNKKDYKVIGENIDVQIKVNRKFSKNDPYGEEIWENELPLH